MRYAFLLAFAGLLAAQTTYTFRKVADNAPGSPFQATVFSPFQSHFAINDDGAVAFSATQVSGLTAAFLASPSGELTRLFAQQGQTAPPRVLGLNNRGQVLFFEGTRLAMWTTGRVTTVYSQSSNVVNLFFASLNDEGTVALSTTTRILTVDDAGTQREIVGENEVTRANLLVPPFLAAPTINNAGEVAFVTAGLAQCDGCVYKKSGSRLLTVSPSRTVTSPAMINNRGDVAFLSPRPGIFAGDGGPARLVVDLAARELNFIDTFPSFNDQGQVAFQASITLAGGSRGIFAGGNPTQDRVIRVNDPLFGSTVTALETLPLQSGKRVNNRGEIVFLYTLSNGLSGVAVASPSPSTPQRPSIAGTVNAASFQSGGSLNFAPGGVVSIFGQNLAPQLAPASTVPLPDQLDGTRVLVNGSPVPLYFVSPTQINAQLPYDLAPGPATIQVTSAGGSSATGSLEIALQAPALYTLPQNGQGQAVAVFGNSATLVAPPGVTADSRPARAGDVIVLYANSLGAVDPPIPPGWNSCAESRCAPGLANVTLRRAVRTPQIIIGSVRVPQDRILFAGLAPQFPGLYQINLIVPEGIDRGPAVPIFVFPANAPPPRSTPTTIAID